MAAELALRLAEVQHRLLGNFQLLHALVGIRLRTVTDPESRRHLNWLNDVVAALGLLNRRLVEGSVVDFSEYLAEATAFWRRTCDGRPIGFVLQADAMGASDGLASSLALIVHELIANAVEHAFPEDRAGSVSVDFRHGGDFVALTVSDDGVGQPAAFRQNDGLGLVRGLVEHLGGSIEVGQGSSGKGTAVTVRAPLKVGPAPAH